MPFDGFMTAKPNLVPKEPDDKGSAIYKIAI